MTGLSVCTSGRNRCGPITFVQRHEECASVGVQVTSQLCYVFKGLGLGAAWNGRHFHVLVAILDSEGAFPRVPFTGTPGHPQLWSGVGHMGCCERWWWLWRTGGCSWVFKWGREDEGGAGDCLFKRAPWPLQSTPTPVGTPTPPETAVDWHVLFRASPFSLGASTPPLPNCSSKSGASGIKRCRNGGTPLDHERCSSGG